MSDRRQCACIFESTSGPPIQWCSHHAMLRKELKAKDQKIAELEASTSEWATKAGGQFTEIFNLKAENKRLREAIIAYDRSDGGELITTLLEALETMDCEHEITEHRAVNYRGGNCLKCGAYVYIDGVSPRQAVALEPKENDSGW